MSEKLNIQYLLENVKTISNEYDKIARSTGENFNIFSVMRAESDEVRTHSRIIAELLNPKGSHGQGCAFLECFFDEIKELRTIENFDFERAKVVVEEHAGLINEDYTEGGFIDIVIKDNKNQVIIENKIYAGDQPKQLLRYKKAYPRGKLLYLTLDGKKPSKNSYDGLPELLKLEDIVLVSYSSNVKVWLEKCIEKIVSLPTIRETLAQYLNLIKKLTNQTTNSKMSKEMVELLKKDIKSSFDIYQNISDLKSSLYYEFLNLFKDYALSNDLIFNDENKDSDIEYGFYIKPKLWSNNKFSICFMFGERNYTNFFYGLSYEDGIGTEEQVVIEAKFNAEGFDVKAPWIWLHLSDRDWADNAEIWEEVAKGKDGRVYKEILQKIDEIINIEKS